MRRSTARKIKPHLRALRRHARALTGGDNDLLQRTLQAVRDDNYRRLAARDVRTRLFRDFHDLVAAAQGDVAEAPPVAVDRFGLMLRHIQGFSIQEVSDILRGDVLDMQGRLEQAYRDLHGRDGADLLLVQDDAVLASAMIQAVESMGHRVLGMSADDEEALATAQAIRVDAVVVDVSGRFTGRRFTGRGAGAGDSSAMDRLLGQIAAPIVIVASGDPETGDMAHSGRDPAYLVTTPFQPPELKVMLNQALHNRA